MARIRGQLSAEEPGARGIEHWARNPDCTRLGALTLTGISPATAVTKVYHEHPNEGQSPFAISIGNKFERLLTEQGAAKLLDVYRQAGRLQISQARVVVLDEFVPLGSNAAMQRRRTYTRKYIQQKLNGDPHAPNIIIHGRIQIELLGVAHDIEPDALIAADDESFYRPVEIKSFADRDGKTDPADIRGAARQAAVEVLGLRQLLAGLGIVQPEILVPAMADLILRQPGSSKATLRPMTLQQECDSIEALLEHAEQDLRTLEALLQSISSSATLDDPMVLDQVSNNYQPICKEFCPLATHCKREAIQASNPILLGSRVREELAPAGSIIRALDLLNGEGGPPRTPAEHMLAKLMREADAELRKAVS